MLLFVVFLISGMCAVMNSDGVYSYALLQQGLNFLVWVVES